MERQKLEVELYQSIKIVQNDMVTVMRVLDTLLAADKIIKDENDKRKIFISKRIDNQEKYINRIWVSDLSDERKKELMDSAKSVIKYLKTI